MKQLSFKNHDEAYSVGWEKGHNDYTKKRDYREEAITDKFQDFFDQGYAHGWYTAEKEATK